MTCPLARLSPHRHITSNRAEVGKFVIMAAGQIIIKNGAQSARPRPRRFQYNYFAALIANHLQLASGVQALREFANHFQKTDNFRKADQFSNDFGPA
jgi:hypothetical protein